MAETKDAHICPSVVDDAACLWIKFQTCKRYMDCVYRNSSEAMHELFTAA